jgi:beta-phosphoglucomutase
MPLKAVLFDFNGVILDDEPIHQQLIDDILLNENLKPQPGEFQKFCLGRSDRACLFDLLSHRGRAVTSAMIDKLIVNKNKAYRQRLDALESLPLFPGLQDLILQFHAAQIQMAVVTGALESEVEEVLARAQLRQYFSVVISADQLNRSKPDPEGYLLAVHRLSTQSLGMPLQPNECLAIEDTFVGIEAAKQAGIPVVGVAHTYPFHMLQRCTNWTVDYLYQLEVDRILEVFNRPAVMAETT